MTSAATLNQTSTAVPSRAVRMIVADDSPTARQQVLGYLAGLDGVEVTAVCENGRRAVETALRGEPDVVLLDLHMPVMSGLEAAEIFRNSMPHVGVILTSTHDQVEVREACLTGGADAFVGKHTIHETFPAVLETVLGLRRSPARHRRAPSFVTNPLTDLFAPPRPFVLTQRSSGPARAATRGSASVNQIRG